ncbi:mettl23 [Symbiodinium sp. CCMP2592]|nr:mettl23 [Symbiodinium sp. CCMP2592]
MQEIAEEGDALVPVLQQAAMAFREGNPQALQDGLQELLEEMRAQELWKGERALRASRLDGAASKELGVDSMTTWLCRMLMKEELASLAEELIEEISAAKKEEVLRVPLEFGVPPELLISVGSHVLDWTMADGRFIWHGTTAALKLLRGSEAAEIPRLQVADKVILELGCGLGVVGLACARAGAKRVVLTDYDKELLCACQRSIALNSLEHIVSTLHLDWSCVSSGLLPEDLNSDTIDIVIGADIIYDADHAQSVLGALCHFLQSGRANSAILITGEPDRRQGVKQLDESLGLAEQWPSEQLGPLSGQLQQVTWILERLPGEERSHRLYSFQLVP